MKILYAIQGTGNGHISRAIEIIPYLRKYASVDILISGIQSDIDLPFEVKYKCYGLSFIFGKKGGINIYKTFKKSRIRNLINEIKSLPVKNYNLVISDFEPVSCWASYYTNVPCVGLSNQAAVMAQGAPQPEKFDPIGKLILKHYAPVNVQYGFHFQRYNSNIYTPIIRKEIRELKTTNQGHYIVYLPAYSDKRIIKVLSQIKKVKWHVFSKHTDKIYSCKNIFIQPINRQAFIKSFASCSGIICGAGFATPAEALFLNKKLMVIPMKLQYEQQCNALALHQMGVAVLKSLKTKHTDKIINWINNDKIIKVDYPDETEKIILTIINQNIIKPPVHIRPNTYILANT
jgi:uncharacterized protein (TIGR00661 family)